MDFPPRPIDQSNKAHALQLGIAQDIKWLLVNGEAPCDLTALVDRYLRLFSDMDLAIMSGRVWSRKLLPGGFPSANLS